MQLSKKAKQRIEYTADAITKDPSSALIEIADFLKYYTKPENANYIKLLKEIVASTTLTWKIYQKSPNIREIRKEFNKYLRGMLAGCWNTLHGLPKP